MNELDTAFRLEIRLSALEFLVARTHALLLLNTLGSRQEVLETLDSHAENAPEILFKGLDAVWSDAASAEWANAIRRLVDIQKEIIGSARMF